MTNELNAKLIEKYPNLYAQIESVECEDGWGKLINGMSFNVEKGIERAGSHPALHALSVKEENGILKVRMKAVTPEILKYIQDAEDASYMTCCKCGEVGYIRKSSRKVLCDKCVVS